MQSSNSPHVPWQSAYMDDHEDDGSDRGRALGTLIFAGALAAAVVKLLAITEGPFPELFCTVCAVCAALGITVAIISALRKKADSWLRACLKLPALLSLAVTLGLTAGAIYRHALAYRIAYARAAKAFETVEDHVDFIQLAQDEKLKRLALETMRKTFSQEEIERGYVQADMRAIREESMAGKGLFLAVAPRTAGQEASVTIQNKTRKTVILLCDGPQNVQLPIAPSGQETFLLAPGDYQTTVTYQPQDGFEPLALTKHVVATTRYRGIIDADEDNNLIVGELDPKLLVKGH